MIDHVLSGYSPIRTDEAVGADELMPLGPKHPVWNEAATALLKRATFEPRLPVIVCGHTFDPEQANGEHLGEAATGDEARRLATDHFSLGAEQDRRIYVFLWISDDPYFGALDRTTYDHALKLAAAQPGSAGLGH